MVKGRLLKFLDKSFSGDMIYTSAIPNARLGGLMPSRQTIPLSLIHPKNAELEYALLDIGVLVPSENINWRVKVNGISVTKEFKPHAIVPAGNMLFAKLVYDITSILKTPESLHKRRANITFKLEGVEQIIIEQVAIIALYNSSEAETKLTFLSGALSLKPGEKTSTELNGPFSEGVLRTTIYIPSSMANVNILLNNKDLLKIRNTQGMDEYLTRVSNLGENNELLIEHEETNTIYYPKEVRVSNILLYSVKYSKPVLELIDTTIPEKIRSGEEISLKIINKGEAKPDRALIVVMNLGNVVARKKIKLLEPGESVDDKIKLEIPPGEYDLVFRIIWGKLSQTWFKDFRYHIVVTD
jgi:hypothetical protein